MSKEQKSNKETKKNRPCRKKKSVKQRNLRSAQDLILSPSFNSVGRWRVSAPHYVANVFAV